MIRDYKNPHPKKQKSLLGENAIILSQNYTNKEDDLDPREEEILQIVLEDYIKTGSPISSLLIVEKHNVKWSSATIRNILGSLSEKGYLYAPHRSSGKIPTAKGFRFFSKKIPTNLSPYQPTRDKQNIIQREFLKRKFEIPDLLESSCNILSILTNYMSIAIPPLAENSILRHIELIDIGNEEILVVILTRAGNVYSRILYVNENIPKNILEQISRFLNENFSGRDLREIHSLFLSGNITPLGEMYRYTAIIIDNLSKHFETLNEVKDIITAGIDKLVESLKENKINASIGSIYNLKDIFKEILKKSTEIDDIVVSIEGDKIPELFGLSILTGSYSMGGKNIGAMGVVGPNRMDYISAIQIIEYLRIMISSMITKINC